MNRRRSAGKLFRLALVLAVMGEIGVRLGEWGLVDGSVGSLAWYVEFEEDYYHIRPGVRVVQPERYGDIPYTFNRLGFRGTGSVPEPGDRSILFLGDSVTFGLGVGDHETFPHLIEWELNSGDTGHERPRGSSLAMFGFAPTHEAAALRRVGLRMDPDIVVLQLYMNDFYLGRKQVSRGAPPATIWGRLRAGFRLLRDQSALYRRLRQVAKGGLYYLLHDVRRLRFPDRLNAAEPEQTLALLREHPRDTEFETFEVIREIQGLAAERHIPLLVLITPNEVQLFRADFDAINQRVRAFCEEHQIPFFDPLEAFRAAPGRHRLFRDGLHLSPLGHRILADLLVPRLEDLLEPATPGNG